MGARRPRTAPKPEKQTDAELAFTAAQVAHEKNVVDTAKKIVELSDGIPYASLRLKSPGGKLRYSNNSLLIEATDDQSITLYGGKKALSGLFVPFVHFKVMPSGVEIPEHNVTGAIPSDAKITAKLSVRGRNAARAERLKARMGELQAENEEIARKASIQEVDDEDDDVDESLDADPDDDVEGDLGGDDEEGGDDDGEE